jgi:hypothetical protein
MRRADSSSAVGDVSGARFSPSPALPTQSPESATAPVSEAKTAASVVVARSSADGKKLTDICGDAAIGDNRSKSAPLPAHDARGDVAPCGLSAPPALDDGDALMRNPETPPTFIFNNSGLAARTAESAEAALRGSATTAYKTRNSGDARACVASRCARRASERAADAAEDAHALAAAARSASYASSSACKDCRRDSSSTSDAAERDAASGDCADGDDAERRMPRNARNRENVRDLSAPRAVPTHGAMRRSTER